MRTLSRFWNDDQGTIVSAEIILVLTNCRDRHVGGADHHRDQVTLELADLGTAIGQFNHTYSIAGVNVSGASIATSVFDDLPDFCDDTSSDPTDPANAVRRAWRSSTASSSDRVSRGKTESLEDVLLGRPVAESDRTGKIDTGTHDGVANRTRVVERRTGVTSIVDILLVGAIAGWE